MNYFILVKNDCYTNQGSFLTGAESARLLLEKQFWPLWQNTACKEMVKDGDHLLIYIAGQGELSQTVFSSALVKGIKPWDRSWADMCPLSHDDIPEKVLMLGAVKFFSTPVKVQKKLDELSFVPADKSKWGVAFMGGMRRVTKQDYKVLSV